MDLPTEDDWRPDLRDSEVARARGAFPEETEEEAVRRFDPDRAWAYKIFRGRTRDEAIRLFEDADLTYSEALMYMPSRAFGFYFSAYVEFARSDVARDDWLVARTFFSTIGFFSEHEPEKVRPFWSEIEPVLKEIVEKYNDQDPELWLRCGCFRAEVHKMVLRGFAVSFDTSAPEIVPKLVTMRHLSGPKPFSWPVAVQTLPQFRHRRRGCRLDEARYPPRVRAAGSVRRRSPSNLRIHPALGAFPVSRVWHSDWLR